jgi:ABC-type branched-subunit amino acid transport system ATPase component
VSRPILEVRGLRAGYGDEDVLQGVSLDLPGGAIVAVIGPNGSGKSTLLKTIYGLVPARAGEITVFDETGAARSLVGLRPHEITALGINMVPQLGRVFGDLSVRENLEIGAMPIRHRFAERLEHVAGVLPLLRPLLHRRAATLSGGQRQMVGVARALMSDPRLLILDEPSAGLAPNVLAGMFDEIKGINAAGISVLIVEQRARQCLAMADYGYVLDQGRNRLEGTAQTLLADPEVVRLYLGMRGDPQPSRPPGRH